MKSIRYTRRFLISIIAGVLFLSVGFVAEAYGQSDKIARNHFRDSYRVSTPPSRRPATPIPARWSPWSACSTTCGAGTQTRTCTEGKYGGTLCKDTDGGNPSRSCTVKECARPTIKFSPTAISPNEP